ncbi:MAG: acyl-CoA thioesterase [Bryobacterales bacterium]|nr:acyl-CoA thioesterase [Bryobacterales bacterium]
MAYEYTITRTVEFSETDMAGIVHFSNFFRYMEAAEHAFFRSLGMSIHPPPGEIKVGWPRVHASLDFSSPLRFEDTVEVRLLVKHKRRQSLHYAFRFRKLNEDPPREVARGSLSVTCVKRDFPGGPMKATPIPEDIAARIEEAPEELLR